MIIGIMGAMPEEVANIHELMTDIQTVDHGSRHYYQGYINTIPVVLVFSRWGKVAASSTVTALITEFNITHLIFTGVAGAAASYLNVGDIIISQKLYQHDMDARPLIARHEIPLTQRTFFKADKQLVEFAYQAAQQLTTNITHSIDKETLERFSIHSPSYYKGTIATGDQFVSDAANAESILSETDALEMEGGAVAQVCYDYAIPFVIMRTMSDKADADSAIDFPAFIKDIASIYSRCLIESFFDSLAEKST